VDAFVTCEIELCCPKTTIENITKAKKKKKELTNEELKKILAPTIIIQKVETKKKKKKFGIANKVITNKKIISTL
jgi:hypothetical protein